MIEALSSGQGQPGLIPTHTGYRVNSVICPVLTAFITEESYIPSTRPNPGCGGVAVFGGYRRVKKDPAIAFSAFRFVSCEESNIRLVISIIQKYYNPIIVINLLICLVK